MPTPRSDQQRLLFKREWQGKALLTVGLAGGLIAFAQACTPNFKTINPIDLASAEGSTIGPSMTLSSNFRLMPLGDSITWGYLDIENGGYRAYEYSALQAAGYSPTMVGSVDCEVPAASPDCEGHPGWTILQIDSQVVQMGLLEQANPDVIQLMIGVNSLTVDASTGAIQGTDVSVEVAELQTLIDHIYTHMPKVHLIVASVMQTNNSYSANLVPVFNTSIPGIVASKAAQGFPITYVDMYSVVPLANTQDGLHPSDLGYQQLAQAWFRAIRTILP